jgi:hypothetical protein
MVGLFHGHLSCITFSQGAADAACESQSNRLATGFVLAAIE